MTYQSRRYDGLWSSFRQEEVKRMAVLWGGTGKLRKDECIEYLRAALGDPARIDAGIARMRPHVKFRPI